MQPVFKCDYCKFMGTEEEVKQHEEECRDNYTKRSCYTCQHRQTLLSPNIHFECDKGKEIPEGSLIEYCTCYEQKEKDELTDKLKDIFSSGPFGW